MSRKEMFLRTRGRLLSFLFLMFVLIFTQAIIIVFGVLVNHGFPNGFKENILTLAKIDAIIIAFTIAPNWKYWLDIIFASTKIFSGYVILGQQIFSSKVESCEGAQWELIEKNGKIFVGKFKIYSDRMGLIYPANELPADLCAGLVKFRYMKRCKYIVEIIQIEKK